MLSRTTGFSTVECLVALVILAIGILGSAGTMGLAIRSAHAGAAASSSARLFLSLRDSLEAVVRASGGGCGALGGGSGAGSHGVRATWRVTSVTGGRDIELAVDRDGLRGPSADTLVAFVPCH